MTRLSKSRVMSSLQCAKRVHLEVHHRELAEVSASTQAAWDVGHAIGEIARRIYGDGTLVPWSGGSFAPALQLTHSLMTGLVREPLFEATLEHEGVLVREDVLLPDGDGWRVVEVKAATTVKEHYVQDCAIQAWVHLGSGHALGGIALGHVDNQWIWDGGDDYRGLLIEQDLTEAVMALQPSVPHWIDAAREAVAGPMPDIPVGQHCYKPYECPFVKHCWPNDSQYPVQGLGGGRAKLGQWITAGYRDLREVPTEALSETQRRIAGVTRLGVAEIGPEAGVFVRALGWPRYYLDFETVSPAIPRWPGTRPYETLPFQYSCHVEHGPGQLDHVWFLDLSGEAPMRALAEQLIADLGNQGPVLMYTGYERGVLAGLASRFPDLAGPLNAVIDRLVDLHPVTRASYYHPDMLGSWSIKAVVPTIDPDLDYAALPGVKEGTAASEAYLRAIDPDIDAEERERLRKELLVYCRHDTLAMVALVRFFEAH